jgi:hypothetical protein
MRGQPMVVDQFLSRCRGKMMMDVTEWESRACCFRRDHEVVSTYDERKPSAILVEAIAFGRDDVPSEQVMHPSRRMGNACT